jgi:protein SCO1/2
MGMRLPAAAAALLGVLVIVAGCGGGGEQVSGLKGFTRDPVPDVGSVSLPDVGPGGAGKAVPMKAGPGELLVVYFGFTSCPDVCPTTLGDVRGALGRLTPAERKRVEAAMVTVDPKRDTATVMRNYVGHFFTTWRAYRTTDSAALAAAERAFGASHSIQPRTGGKYDVVHSAFTYVVDDEGRVVVEWPFAMPRRDIAADLSTLLKGDTNT